MQRNVRLAIALGILVAFQGAARAAIPSEFTVQGVLRDNAGKLESQMVMLTISFFDAQTNGSQLGASFGPTAAMASNGLFTHTVTLANADVTAIGGAAAVFLQLVVDGNSFPRQKVEPQMYALLCQNASQLGGVPASSYAPASGSANYAPASGSANYAPASGSANYAPASGSASYEHVFASGLPCGAGNWVTDVDNSTGAVTCSPIAALGVSTAMLAANSVTNAKLSPGYALKFAPQNPVTVNGSNSTILTANLGDTVTLGLDTTVGAAGQILHMTAPAVWAHTAVVFQNGANPVTQVPGPTGLCASCVSAGARVVSGNCQASATLGIMLAESYANSSTTWCCSWTNSGAGSVTYTASANCL